MLLQTVEINSLLNILETIENTEYETLIINKEKLEFASGRLTNISGGLANLQKAYSTTIIQSYKTQYNKIQNLLAETITRINQICSNNSCDEKLLESISTLVGTQNNGAVTLDTSGIDFDNRTDEKITEEIKKRIPNTLTSFFHIKDVDPTCTDEGVCTDSGIKYAKLNADDFNNQDLAQEIKTKIKTMFQSKDADEELIIPGLNILTPDRPIDSPRYITFQGVNAQEVKLIYPDLYKVEVYKTSGDIQLLKTIPEIKAGIQTYLRNKIEEYNTLLHTAKGNVTMANTLAYSKLKELNFSQATPSLDTAVREYRDFTYNDLLQALGGESQLDVLAELLYYQNATNKEKVNKSAVLDDLNATRDSFDFNNKTKYILQEYLTEKNPKLQRTNS
ncbi:MAG: hypothetical protein LBO09_07695 [Candidatus Peribacteria bacterium]|jgi:peroxiredoxin|nr:hypothetical protein [Candidatus Peribacteria bacterium]